MNQNRSKTKTVVRVIAFLLVAALLPLALEHSGRLGGHRLGRMSTASTSSRKIRSMS